jgi:hypothetical protein
MSGLEVTDSVTSLYPPRVQKVFVTSKIKTIPDALKELNLQEFIDRQHHNPQQWSEQNRPQAGSS